MALMADNRTDARPDMRDVIVQKCPVCGEAMIAGGTCDICGYSEAVTDNVEGERSE